jgi:hypothetical protein
MISPHWICIHRGTIGPWSDKDVFARWRPPFVKIVWDGSQVPYLEDIPADAKIVWRNYPLSEQFHGGFGTVTPEQAAQAYVQNAVEVAAYCESKGVSRSRLLFEGPNEFPVWQHGYDGLARLEAARLAGLHKAGLWGVVCNLGVGWPGNTGTDTPPVWDWFKPVINLFGNGDYLGLHEYWGFEGPLQNWGWWAGRALKCPYRVPMMMTECGIDGGVLGAGHVKQGWYDLPDGSMNDKANRYLNELWQYADLLREDGRTKALFPYTYDGNRDDWGRFEIRTEVFLQPFFDRIAAHGLPQPGTFTVTGPTGNLNARLQAAFGGQYADFRNGLPTHPTDKYIVRSESVIKRIIVHHTATVVSTWENVARYHVEHNGWPGVGYHFGIMPDGSVRYLGDVNTRRYHAGPANTDSIGISFMGNYMTDLPTTAALNALALLRSTLEKYLGRTLDMQGHRDVSETACPGDNLYAVLFGSDKGLLEGALYTAAEAADVLQINPKAALCKAGKARGLWPTSNEFPLTVEGVKYIAQRFRDPDRDDVWVLYCVDGEWGNVRAFRY